MTYSLRVRRQAESDLLEAYTWYEDRRPGLGAEFLNAVDASFQAIRRHPLTHSEVRGRVRRALLERFPYGIFYVVEGSDIAILACLHGRRHPEILRGRW